MPVSSRDAEHFEYLTVWCIHLTLGAKGLRVRI